MRFVCRIQVALPPEWTAEQREELRQRELDVAVELIRRGIIRRTFRVVGAPQGNFSIWETSGPEELSEVFKTLPMYPYMTIAVTPVIKHDLEEEYERRYGPLPEFS